MADVNINKFRASVVRDGSKPASPGFIVSEGQDPVNPPGTNNYVPYSGATANVELGEYGVEAGFITLDTTPTNTPTDQGTIFWDADDETVDIVLNGYTMKIGEDLFYPVKNQTGSTIAKGVAVRFNGTVGASGRLLIAPFIADGSVPSSRFMGVTAEEILNGEDGKVLYFGRVRGINTNAFNEGDILYASTTTAGGYQTAIPVAPNNIVQVAAVVTKSATVGTIFVRPTLGSNINKDEGVKIVSVADKNLLQYQSGTSLWENKSLAQVLGGTSAQFVKGDGSLDSTSYGTGTVTSVGLSSATSGVTIGSSPVTTSGTITLAIATASGSQNGLLSSTDWTTFNNKQNALTNPVTGTGASGQVAYFNGTTSITSESALLWDSTNDRLGIGVSPAQKLDVNGIAQFRDDIRFSTTNSSIGYTDAIRFVELGVSTRLTLSSGNLGLGVTPSAWNSAYKAMQFGTTGAIFGESGDAANYFTTNTFVDSVGFKYITSDWALGYFQENGVHSWRNAPSGTAGNAISFTQAMTLFSTGNLLVGTPSPISDNGARLQVSGTATISGITSTGTNTFISASTSTEGLIVRGGSSVGSASSASGQILIGQTPGYRGSLSYDDNAGYLYIDNTYNNNSGNIYFRTKTGATAINALIIAGSGAATFSSSVTASGGVNAGDSKFFNSVQLTDSLGGTCQGFLWTDAANTLKIGTGTVAGVNVKMTITSSGNVGIGTPIPNAKLLINGTGDLSYIYNSGASTTDANFYIYNATRDILIVRNSGNVGIGTASPTSGLELGSGLDLKMPSNGNIIFGNSNVLIYKTSGQDGLSFNTGGSEKMRITSSGNVLIGSPPAADNGARLQVSGKLTVTHSSTDFVTEIINTASTNPYGLRVKDASGAANNYPLFSVSNNAGSVEYFRVNSGTGTATFSSGIATNGYTASTSYAALFNGNVGIGTNTPEATGLTIAGGGIIASLDSGANRKVIELYASSTGAKVSSTYVGSSSYDSLELLTSNIPRLTITAAGEATFSNSVKTGAPSGGTAQPWRLGSAATVSPTSPNRTIEVEVNGTTYYLHAKTTNN